MGQHHDRLRRQGLGFAAGSAAIGLTGRLAVEGVEFASASIDDTAPVMLNFSGMFTCGYHHMEPFRLGIRPPLRFTGAIRRVGIVTSATQTVDPDNGREVFLKRHMYNAGGGNAI